MAKALLVTGATGRQGGSLVNALLKANTDIEILALTRNAQSTSARKLQAKSPNIKLVTGNLDAIDSVFQKAREASKVPIWGVFSVQVAMGNGASAESEERQGKALVDAAIKNGVKHFVYSSVDRGGPKSDQDATNVPHFASKHRIEQHLFSKSSVGAMDWTVLRPVAFFENLQPDFVGKVFATAWASSLGPDQPLQLIATSDIGLIAAEAFLKPNEYKGQKISLAGDELTYTQFKTIFEEKTGQPLPTTFGFVASAIMMMVKDMRYMFKWFGDVGYGADIPALRQVHPDLKDFATWLEKDSSFKTQ
ncbi:hypothetical protein FB567DRAFT_453100 [Paraphoma chrysanthemicola]|uniref:NmrA-like domain-containing protein n=1 Tax=Paraphoma chrysanthemicola TaxID=798071 RepID=A0A8K0QYF4_9PLEO|nr:hypothetical protein FB567DRAFT_453100 [Paraphoma chrysanthemicola]